MKPLRLLLLACSVLHLSSRAADLGDPAAELAIAKWIKGEPTQINDNAKAIHVVEFWATWCPPCRTSIPHLTSLQQRFKDNNVIFVGISDEEEKVVKKFVDQMGPKMDYRVALDDKDKTAKGYMKAYGIGGIPHAFVVQNKKVLWQGHPMAGLDQALDQIVAGKYDIASARARQRVEDLYDQFRQAAFNGQDEQADKLTEELRLALKEVKDPSINIDFVKERKELRAQGLRNQYTRALSSGQADKAEKLAAALKDHDPSIDLTAIQNQVEANRLAQKYFQALDAGTDKEETAKIGRDLAAKLKGNSHVGNEVSWHILTGEGLKHRDIPLALDIAKQACEDSNWKQAHIIDTYARALFDSGKKEDAVEFQKKAVAAATDPEMKSSFEKILKNYQEGKVE